MKCPNCNQELIDNKVFCPNCGKQLKNENMSNITPLKTFLIFVVIMLLLGAGTLYLVANTGVNKPIDKTIPNPIEEKKDFYGSYLIKEIIITDDSHEAIEPLKDSLIGFEIELKKDKLKVGLFQVAWVKIINPKEKEIENLDKYKLELNIDSEDSMGLNIEGVNSEEDGGEVQSFDFVSIGNRLFMYYLDTYFELEESTLGFNSSNTYYKVDLLKETYHESINNEIKAINIKTKEDVESNLFEIYIKEYDEYVNGNITTLVIKEYYGYINSELVSSIKTITFNKNTGEKVNLKAYIEYIGKDYDDIMNKYDINKELVYEMSMDIITDKFEKSPDLMYYVKDNILYIACGTDNYGTLFAEVNLEGE